MFTMTKKLINCICVKKLRVLPQYYARLHKLRVLTAFVIQSIFLKNHLKKYCGFIRLDGIGYKIVRSY